MNRNPLPPPPQMGNCGSPPAHLPSSSLSNPAGWLQYKSSQPPPRAPEWVFDYYERYNPPASVGRPLCDEEWLQRVFRKDHKAAGLLPTALLGGPILHGAPARAKRAYKDWKWAINDLWEEERRRLQLVDEQDARTRHNERCRQQLVDEQAARARQEAACRQQLVDKQAARARHANERRR
jgi:hypothetical protein